jgi:hypothetical protein
MNLRNLQTAVVSHSVDHAGGHGDMPRAGSFELRGIGRWHEYKGWVSWIPKSGKKADWPDWGDRKSHYEESKDMVDAGHVGERALLGITEGSLFGYTSKEVGIYSCPVAVHDKRFREFAGATKRTDKVHLSYVMNEFFHYQFRKSWDARNLSWIGTNEKTKADGQDVIPDASRLLLFAEHSGAPWTTDAAIIGRNCVLNVPDSQKAVAVTRLAGNKVPGIGGYHDGPIKLRDADKKLIPWGLVIFVDGHIEKLFPNVRDTTSAAKNTGWLLTRGRDLPDHLK